MKYVPNAITFLRVVLTIALNVYIFLDFGEVTVPLILTAIIFSSDALDGWVARKYNAATKFGVWFDAFADIFYVVLTYAVLYGYHILPMVGMILILFKFLEFTITSSIINAQQDSIPNAQGLLVFDRIGKAVGILLYIMPITTFFFHQTFANYNHPIHIVIGIYIALIGVLAIISSWNRIGRCVRISNRSTA